MAQLQGSGAGGGYRPTFKKKAAVKAPSAGPTLPKYTMPRTTTKKPVVKAKATPRRAPAPPAPRSYGSSGGGGSSTRGGSLGSSRGGQISYSTPPPPPKPPSLADFLKTDSTYSMQQSALEKAKADYLAQQGKTKTQYETSYTGDLATLGENRTAALADLENDYAGRGLLQSGLYADSLATTNNDWNKRQSALEQARAAFLSGLTDDFTNFSQEQTLTLQRAQQEAAARMAAQSGI